MQPIEVRQESYRSEDYVRTRMLRSLKSARTWTKLTSFCGFAIVLLTLLRVISVTWLLRAQLNAGFARTIVIVYGVMLLVTMLLYGIPSLFLIAYSRRVGKLLETEGLHDLPGSMASLRRFWMAAAIVALLMICLTVVYFGWATMGLMNARGVGI